VAEDGPPFANIYVACALTWVSADDRPRLIQDCSAIVESIVDVARGEGWRIDAYDPITHTPPWEKEGRRYTPAEVWDIDSLKVSEADAVVVHGVRGGSTGVGIEVALAFTRGIPILYLHSESGDASRLVKGMPAFLDIDTILDSGDEDRSILKERVAGWVRRWYPVIAAGPANRAAADAAFAPLHRRLAAWWAALPPADRTLVAQDALMTEPEVGHYLRSTALFAGMPAFRLDSLRRALGSMQG
jgi:hypothetical protein